MNRAGTPATLGASRKSSLADGVSRTITGVWSAQPRSESAPSGVTVIGGEALTPTPLTAQQQQILDDLRAIIMEIVRRLGIDDDVGGPHPSVYDSFEQQRSDYEENVRMFREVAREMTGVEETPTPPGSRSVLKIGILGVAVVAGAAWFIWGRK